MSVTMYTPASVDVRPRENTVNPGGHIYRQSATRLCRLNETSQSNSYWYSCWGSVLRYSDYSSMTDRQRERESNDKDRGFIQARPRLMKSPWHAGIVENTRKDKPCCLWTTRIVLRAATRHIQKVQCKTMYNRSVCYFAERIRWEQRRPVEFNWYTDAYLCPRMKTTGQTRYNSFCEEK